MPFDPGLFGDWQNEDSEFARTTRDFARDGVAETHPGYPAWAHEVCARLMERDPKLCALGDRVRELGRQAIEALNALVPQP